MAASQPLFRLTYNYRQGSDHNTWWESGGQTIGPLEHIVLTLAALQRDNANSRWEYDQRHDPLDERAWEPLSKDYAIEQMLPWDGAAALIAVSTKAFDDQLAHLNAKAQDKRIRQEAKEKAQLARLRVKYPDA